MPRFLTPLAFLNFEIPFAVYIAIGLILIAAVVLIVSRLGILPDKGSPLPRRCSAGSVWYSRFSGVAVQASWERRRRSSKNRSSSRRSSSRRSWTRPRLQRKWPG